MARLEGHEMKAAMMTDFGPADTLSIVDVPVPIPREDEVLVKVERAGIIWADVQMRAGKYQRKYTPTPPAILGHEGVGTIDRIGDRVTTVEAGVRVAAEFDGGGAYAEYATTKASRVVSLPDHVTFDQAVVYSFNVPSAYLLYKCFGDVPNAATVLVHSGAGGLGEMLTRIAKRHGNTVIALTSREDKMEACRSAGADHVLKATGADYAEDVLALTNGKGVNVIFNHVMGETLAADLKALAFRGLWIFPNRIGGVDQVAAIDRSLLWQKCPSIVPAAMQELFETPAWTDALDYLADWFDKETLAEPTRVFPLSEIAAAHKWIESRESIGKIAVAI